MSKMSNEHVRQCEANGGVDPNDIDIDSGAPQARTRGEAMFEVRITGKKLNELRMLADWQLREMGFDPDSITAACDYECDREAIDPGDSTGTRTQHGRS